MKFINKLSEALEAPELPEKDIWKGEVPPETYVNITAKSIETTDRSELDNAVSDVARILEEYGFTNFTNISGNTGFLAGKADRDWRDIVAEIESDDRFEDVSDEMRKRGFLAAGRIFKYKDSEYDVLIKIQPRPRLVQFGAY